MAMSAHTFHGAEFCLGLLIFPLVFLELCIKVADDDEVRVLGQHELVVPPREVRHLGN
jgi:hypothetical protein